jgi:hypothetical protein
MALTINEQIEEYINSIPEPKRSDIWELHRWILEVLPAGRLWFLDGKNIDNETVSNPNIGYGLHLLSYSNGTTKEFYKIGLSANTTGISVYIMGIPDKKHLAQTYGYRLGKVSITGYCIKFKNLKDIHKNVLKEILSEAANASA